MLLSLKKCLLSAVLVCVLMVSPECNAAMIIAVSNGNLPTYVAGSVNTVDVSSGPGTVKLSVWAYDSAPVTGVTRTVSGFNLAFDMSPIGNTTIPSNFSGFSVTNSILSPFNLAPVVSGGLNHDFTVNAGPNTAFVLGDISTPNKLFDISFTASQSTAPGTYDFQFSPSATIPGLFGPQNANAVTGTASSLTLGAAGGQFQITAVPEPSSMALMGMMGLGLFSLKCRRKRRKITS